MKPEMSMFRKRLGGLLVVMPLILGLCFVVYKYGPGSIGKAEMLATNAKPEAKAPKAEEVAPSNSQLFDLFGMREAAVAKGHVNVTTTEYLDSLEALYRQRGYQRIDTDNRLKKNRKMRGGTIKRAEVTNFFQREEANGSGSISAIGIDADYTTDRRSTEPFSFSTIVTPTGNGQAEWEAYRLEIDRDKLATLGNLKNGDFPGSDPANIPRLPGLQRIYSTSSPRGAIAMYKSTETENSLLIRYLDEMPRRGWRLDADVTSKANQAARGVMCFTQGPSFCMIWITTDKATGTTNVTISLH